MLLPPTVPSSLTGSPSDRVGRVSTRTLIDAYQAQFAYDASACFAGLEEVGLYKCPDTGMCFYYPFSVAGPESLYRALEKFDWNYKDVKWEHDVALPYIQSDMRILDVGCGEGSFLKRTADKGAQATGIELNKSAAQKAAGKGIEVASEMLDVHARARPAFYDIVTHFQVLEHVTDPRAFLTDCVTLLKLGGLLVVGVPNDGGFVGMDEDMVLNQPPHHMTLWNRKSLEALQTILPIRLQTVEIEPLAETAWYQALMERKFLPRGIRRKFYYRFGGADIFRRYVEANAHAIAGHTILAVYSKTSGHG